MQDTYLFKQSNTLDWLTLTSEVRQTGENWRSTFTRLQSGDAREARFLGFEGHQDQEGLFFGRRAYDARYILILQGPRAHELWEKVTPCKCKVTRIDYATDLWLPTPSQHIGQEAAKLLEPGHENKCKVVYIQGVTGGLSKQSTGDTLYLGSRQSNQFGRLYDKGRQQKACEPGRWLRYEVEFKGAAAKQALSWVQAVAPDEIGGTIKKACFDWFLKRGVSPLFTPGQVTDSFHVRSFMRTTTNRQKLLWLETQVAPTVEYLIGEGLGHQTLSALGLEGYSNQV